MGQGVSRMNRSWLFPLLVIACLPSSIWAQQFILPPALALEAENFTIENDWQVIHTCRENSPFDPAGFGHISGERLLGIDAQNDRASAYHDMIIPKSGEYRLWVRYEYPPGTETRFRIVLLQNEKTILDHLMGSRDHLRHGYGESQPRAQHDPPAGVPGMVEEVVTVRLEAGKGRIYLKGVRQPVQPGIAAPRHIDCLYLTSDAEDSWIRYYSRQNSRYPILDAFRDTVGPRYEVRFVNKSRQASTYTITHVYNRMPFLAVAEGLVAQNVEPGNPTDWIPLKKQDTCHCSMIQMTSSGGSFVTEIRAIGDTDTSRVRTLTASRTANVYLPPYSGKGEGPVTPEEEIDRVLTLLKEKPPIGKVPTQPLCYAGGMPVGIDSDYGRKYAQLYAALGLRTLNPTLTGTQWKSNLAEAKIPLTRSWAVTRFRNPPTPYSVELAQNSLKSNGLASQLKWFDYGEEIAFPEWMQLLVQEQVDQASQRKEKLKPETVIRALWREWLFRNRKEYRADDYWREEWGPVNVLQVRPDSSSGAAAENPRLYIDSIQFFEEISLGWLVNHAAAIRKSLGSDVLCGNSITSQPLYYPRITQTIQWFRSKAGDMGRHTEAFWQAGQAGPMINGYLAEQFLSGMRDNPRAVLRQYSLASSPGNTRSSFLRSCYTHLAHGARLLDFGPIGMNETGEEATIDHRHHERYQAIRDVTHAVGLVEDLLTDSRPIGSGVALLVSSGTERWDMAGAAQDLAGRDLLGPSYRKVRLNHHLERFGLWQALTLAGFPPDLIIEDDLKSAVLDRYKVLILVGDCIPPQFSTAVATWVRNGGVVLATANTGRYDSYRKPITEWQKLFGLETRRSEERESFFRPLQELLLMQPLDMVQSTGWQMPQLGTFERIGVSKDVKVLARFKEDNSPAWIQHRLGEGSIHYVAAQPGVASLWSALQAMKITDRRSAMHQIPTELDIGTGYLLHAVLEEGRVEPILRTDVGHIDGRVLQGPRGWIIPLANYNETVDQKIKISVRINGRVGRCVSAVHGEIPIKTGNGTIEIEIPKLGYGDLLRLTEN